MFCSRANLTWEIEARPSLSREFFGTILGTIYRTSNRTSNSPKTSSKTRYDTISEFLHNFVVQFEVQFMSDIFISSYGRTCPPSCCRRQAGVDGHAKMRAKSRAKSQAKSPTCVSQVTWGPVTSIPHRDRADNMDRMKSYDRPESPERAQIIQRIMPEDCA